MEKYELVLFWYCKCGKVLYSARPFYNNLKSPMCLSCALEKMAANEVRTYPIREYKI